MRPVRWSALLLCMWAAWTQTRGAATLDYPLALKTRWTYHLRHELGEGVHFGDEDAKLARGNVLDTTVVSEAAGVETIGGRQYTRVESRRAGKPWLFEWERLTPEGLLVGKTMDYDSGGQETLMQPEQRRIASNLRPGNFWYWQARNVPMKVRFDVVGPTRVDVPAGHYDAIELKSDGTMQAPFGTVNIRQQTWFVPGIGIARQETDTSVQAHKLAHVTLTLEKFDKP